MKFSIVTACFNQLRYLKENKIHLEKQTITDFEWILASDGCTDGTWEWAQENGITIVGNREHPYDYDWSIYNKAAREAKGEYLTWVMGDSYPKEDYLEWLLKILNGNRIVSGMRQNIDDEGTFISKDWRDNGISDTAEFLRVNNTYLTFNSMAMPHELYEKIGGVHEGYKGYGRADMELAYRAEEAGAECWIVPKAIVYNRNPSQIEDAPHNVRLHEERVGK